MFTYFLISHESHFQLQVLVQAYKIPDLVHFKAPVTVWISVNGPTTNIGCTTIGNIEFTALGTG